MQQITQTPDVYWPVLPWQALPVSSPFRGHSMRNRRWSES